MPKTISFKNPELNQVNEYILKNIGLQYTEDELITIICNQFLATKKKELESYEKSKEKLLNTALDIIIEDAKSKPFTNSLKFFSDRSNDLEDYYRD